MVSGNLLGNQHACPLEWWSLTELRNARKVVPLMFSPLAHNIGVYEVATTHSASVVPSPGGVFPLAGLVKMKLRLRVSHSSGLPSWI